MSKYNLTEIFNESFDSLAKKLDKQKGIDKDEAAKIAGSIAAKKMKGAGSGPTAKQKARVKKKKYLIQNKYLISYMLLEEKTKLLILWMPLEKNLVSISNMVE